MPDPHRPLLALLIGLPLALAPTASIPTRPQEAAAPAPRPCAVDLRLPGQMKDIVSNALVLGLSVPEDRVRAHLEGAERRHGTGPALLAAAAAHFGLGVDVLSAEVERFRHCNCGPDCGTRPAPGDGTASADGPATAATPFARDVMLHVVLHEMAHALVREFDLPVLGNEESLADAFATHYLVTHMPERAPAVLEARVASLMIEARQVPRDEWTVRGEHDSDARRAYQIAALAVAADPERYRAVAALVDMNAAEARRARDYGSELHRSWRRLLAPLWMPADCASTEVRVTVADEPLLRSLCDDGLADELRAALERFDWHSQVTIAFEPGPGGASWSRNGRTITVRSGYTERFVRQGAQLR